MDSATAAAMLQKFLQPGGGESLAPEDSSVTDMLSNRDLQKTMQDENETRLMNDPTNPTLLYRAQHYAADAKANPYSEDNSLARISKSVDANDTMARFLANQPMRDQQVTDAGALEQSKAYGGAYGKDEGAFTAEMSPMGKSVLNARSARAVAENAAKVKAAAGANITQGGEIILPPGTSQESLSPQKGDTGDALTRSAHAQQMFASNGMAEGSRAIVAAILDYRLGAPEKAALARSGQMQKYLGMAEHLDPTFDASQYDAGAALRKDMTVGKTATEMKSLNALSEHIATADKARTNLGNYNGALSPLNVPLNALAKFFGSDKMTNYDLAQNIADKEGGKLLSGSGVASDEATRSVQAGVTGYGSDQQQTGHANTLRDLVSGRTAAFRKQVSSFPRLLPLFEQQMLQENAEQTNKGADPGLSPSGHAHAADTMQQFLNPQGGASSTPAEGTKGSVNGVPAIWKNGNWVRDRSVQ